MKFQLSFVKIVFQSLGGNMYFKKIFAERESEKYKINKVIFEKSKLKKKILI